MDRSNSILRYLKRKQSEKGGENNANGSGVGSNINECQRDGGNEGESNTHKSGGNGPSGGQSSRGSEFDLSTLPMDPSWKIISEYPPNLQDEIRRYYIANGPIQPRSHKFPQKLFCKRCVTLMEQTVCTKPGTSHPLQVMIGDYLYNV